MPKQTLKRGSVPNFWSQCDKCESCVLTKDVAVHSTECPPNPMRPECNFIHKDLSLYGTFDLKPTEDIKGLSQECKDNLVFLSQSVIQICGFSIGQPVCIEGISVSSTPIVKTVWATAEKNLTSVLVTKNSLDLCEIKPEALVRVSHISRSIKPAHKVTVVITNSPKSLELSAELMNRLHKSHFERLLHRGNILGLLFYGKVLKFEVKEIAYVQQDLEEDLAEMSLKEAFGKVVDNTVFVLYKDQADFRRNTISLDPFNTIGGLSAEISELRFLIETVLGKRKSKPIFRSTRAVLLYGSPGTGKSLIANAFARTSKANVVQINAPDLYSKISGSPEQNIKEMFRKAKEQAPSLIVLDEVDVLLPIRSSKMTESEKRIVASILTELDEINEVCDAKIFILATTNKVDGVDASFRRSGRFEREIEIPVPNPKQRNDILQKLLPSDQLDQEIITEVAYETHGFVGADLVALCSRAAQHAAQNSREVLVREDFKFALTRVGPSAMREVQIECPNVKWSDIGGQSKLKLILKQCVEWPLKHADSFIRMGITPPRGVLMYGPPGCSKTMIAKALATESGLNFLSIKGPELFSKWVGESERAVREVFKKARQVAPSIIFFDEIDAIGGERSASASGASSVQERVLAQLLTELDGVTPLGDVTVLAATNRPDRIDKALLRPGRLDRIVHVPLPCEETRREIFRIRLAKMPTDGVDVEELVKRTEGYSGAEINAICNEAAMMALEVDITAVTVESSHFLKALNLLTPRTPQSLLDIYAKYECDK